MNNYAVYNLCTISGYILRRRYSGIEIISLLIIKVREVILIAGKYNRAPEG